MSNSPTGRMTEATSKQLRTPQYQPNPSAQRVIDAYRGVRFLGTDAKRLLAECRQIHGLDFAQLEARVLAMPRALGAPYGTTALRQWTKRERIHARLRIARKEH